MHAYTRILATKHYAREWPPWSRHTLRPPSLHAPAGQPLEDTLRECEQHRHGRSSSSGGSDSMRTSQAGADGDGARLLGKELSTSAPVAGPWAARNKSVDESRRLLD